MPNSWWSLLGAFFVKNTQVISLPDMIVPDLVYSKGFGSSLKSLNDENTEDLWNDWEPEEYGLVIRIHTLPDGHNSGRLGPMTWNMCDIEC